MDKIHIPMGWRMRNVWLVIKSLHSEIFFFPLTQLKLCWKPSCYLWEVKEFQGWAGGEVRVLAPKPGDLWESGGRVSALWFQQKSLGPPWCPCHLRILVVLETSFPPCMSTVVSKGWSSGRMWLLCVPAPLLPSGDSPLHLGNRHHEFIDNNHHICLNIWGPETEGDSPHFPTRM